jgi:thymidylate synthase
MLRKFYPATAAAEAAWFIMAEQDSTWIKKYCPIWDDFVEDDGKTIKAAYGYRWRKHFGRDQLADLISALFVNPSDRRTVLCAWDPGDDGLMNHGTKNVPCPFAMSFYIVGGKLMMSYFIRSSDLYVGLPYDIYCTAFVMDAIVCELRKRARETLQSHDIQGFSEADLDRLVTLSNLTTGTLSTTLANPHMYDKHVSLAREALVYYREHSQQYLNSEIMHGQPLAPPLPGWPLSEIEDNPDAYVEAVRQSFQNCIKSGVSQRPDVAV